MTDDVETWRRASCRRRARQLGEAARLAHETVNAAFRAHVREREPDRYAALLKDFWEKTAAALPSGDPAFVPEARKKSGPEARLARRAGRACRRLDAFQ